MPRLASQPRRAPLMLFVGVDPGTKGALAWINDREGAVVIPLPMQRSRLDKLVYAEDTIAEWFRVRARRPPGDPIVVMIEEPGPMPGKMGSFANYSRGAGPAFFRGICRAYRIPYRTVRPQEWQRAMIEVPERAKRGATETEGERQERAAQRRRALKASSVETALRLFPGVSLYRNSGSRVLDDNMAEALLLAAYLRQLHLGGELFAQRSA